jgi:hypothetical protein
LLNFSEHRLPQKYENCSTLVVGTICFSDRDEATRRT